MIHPKTHTPRRRGVAAVEFAVLLPPILTLLLGIWEVGRIIEIQQLLTNAAREGARQATTGQLTNSQVQTVVTNYLKEAGLPTPNVIVGVSDLTSPGTDVSQANYLDNIQVTASIPYADIKWSVISLITNPGDTINATVQWVSNVDKPFPSNPVPPVG